MHFAYRVYLWVSDVSHSNEDKERGCQPQLRFLLLKMGDWEGRCFVLFEKNHSVVNVTIFMSAVKCM